MKSGFEMLALAAVLAGCAGGAASPQPRIFDLGVEAPAARVPAVRVAPVRSVAPFDGLDMHYRLAWRNASELAAFAHSRWAAPPAELLRKQLLRATGEGVAKCGLEVELHEFSQVFASQSTSQARVEFQAVLVASKGRVASRGWTLTEGDAGADAASGAGAFARAIDQSISAMGKWIAEQPDCR